MTLSGNVILYRYTNAADDYRNSGFTDKIEMDFGLVPDNTGHVRETRWMGQVSLQENPQPTANIPHDVQDLGVSWFTAEIAGFTETPKVTQVPYTLRTWFKEAKQNTNFPYGRFGIRTDDFATFSTEPTSTYGYNLEYLEIARPGEYPKLDLILRFKFNGDINGLGSERT